MSPKMARDSDNAARAHHEEWGIIMSGGFLGADTDFTVTRNAEDFEDLALVPGKVSNGKYFEDGKNPCSATHLYRVFLVVRQQGWVYLGWGVPQALRQLL